MAAGSAARSYAQTRRQRPAGFETVSRRQASLHPGDGAEHITQVITCEWANRPRLDPIIRTGAGRELPHMVRNSELKRELEGLGQRVGVVLTDHPLPGGALQ